MSTIIINGQKFNGTNVTIKNGVVTVDGEQYKSSDKIIKIDITGNVDSLNIDSCESLNVSGNVTDLQTTSADVTCNDILKNAKTTSGDIKANSIKGDATTISGDIKSDVIHGSCKTMSGDIKR